MNQDQPLSLFALGKTAKRLTLLASRDSVGFRELTTLLHLPLVRGQRQLARLSGQLPFWHLYST